ncbi:MAG: hypothetical protein ACLGHL_00575 [Actinomycetota bacterium]
MTALIAGSLVLIVASAVVLVFGWIGANESLIWASIAASVAAAVCLALAYAKSRTPVTKRNPPPKG